jgi:enoyl-CoA hydratase/carnithine racemase
MDYEQILYDVKNNVLTITFNRPERLNAFNSAMRGELIDAFDRANADDTIRAIIVTGKGRAFCVGADLKNGAETFDYDKREDRLDRETRRDGGGRLTLKIFESVKPVIAAINGPAVGVGITMTLAMDIRIASYNASFGLVFSRRGIIPEACSTWFLPRIVGISKALEWVLSGRVFSGEEALRSGLVRSLHSPADLLSSAEAIAREVAENTSAISVALSRQMLWRMLGADHPMEAHKIESRGIYQTGKSDDAREGVESFLEKRSPQLKSKPSTVMPNFFPWWDERRFE